MYIDKDIELLLQEYLVNKSRLKVVENRITDLQEIKKYNYTKFTMDSNDVISSMQLKSILTGLINGRTNKTSNTTEKVALSYKSNLKYTNRIDKITLERNINNYEKELINLSQKVNLVSNLLNALNNYEKFVVEQFYMYCDKNWNEVNKYFEITFNKKRSFKQLKRYKDSALNKMLKILN